MRVAGYDALGAGYLGESNKVVITGIRRCPWLRLWISDRDAVFEERARREQRRHVDVAVEDYPSLASSMTASVTRLMNSRPTLTL
jgi:hypothetical protein